MGTTLRQRHVRAALESVECVDPLGQRAAAACSGGPGVASVTSAAAAVAVTAAARHRLTPAVVACAVQMALTLVYWELMARYWDRYRMSAAASACSTGS